MFIAYKHQLRTSQSTANVARTPRRAFTLIELLLVVVIMLMVSVAAIPIIAPALKGRHIREASRQVNSYFAVARDTALRNRRPVGVQIERFIPRDQQGNVILDADGTQTVVSEMSVVLSQVEVPPDYAGDYADSQMTIEYDTSTGTMRAVFVGSSVSGADSGWLKLLRIGDRLQLGHKGRIYEIVGQTTSDPNSDFLITTPDTTDVPATKYWSLIPIDGSPVIMPAGVTPTGQPNIFRGTFPYRVIRQPVRTAAAPLQLTGSVVLDLNWSGDADGVFVERKADLTKQLTPDLLAVECPDPVIVMFAANGSVERLYRSRFIEEDGLIPAHWRRVNGFPNGTIHLLLGQREAVPADITLSDEAQQANNWRNLDNLWVSINPQTGLITTTEMGDVTEPADQVNPFANSFAGLRTARQFATRGKSMGGR